MDNVGDTAEPLTSVGDQNVEDAEHDVRVVRYFSQTTIQELTHDEGTYPSS